MLIRLYAQNERNFNRRYFSDVLHVLQELQNDVIFMIIENDMS